MDLYSKCKCRYNEFVVIYLHTTFVFVCFWITCCDETDVKEVFFSVENT